VGLLAERLNGSWHGMQLRARLSLGASGEIRPTSLNVRQEQEPTRFLEEVADQSPQKLVLLV
jgi:hypothetical protein